MKKKISPASGMPLSSRIQDRIIPPLKKDKFADRILPSETGGFSKYAILKPTADGKYKRVGGDLKEK